MSKAEWIEYFEATRKLADSMKQVTQWVIIASANTNDFSQEYSNAFFKEKARRKSKYDRRYQRIGRTKRS